MQKKISPTRQELLRLKKQLKTAKSGHKLLKNKLDSLVQEFLSHVKELQKARKEIDEKMHSFLMDYLKAESSLGKEDARALTAHIPAAEVGFEKRNIMGVVVDDFTARNKAEIQNTPLGEISGDHNLKEAKKKSHDILQYIVEYATLEQKIRKLAEEIENTRRRVNSLEHVYIPRLEKNKKYIEQKLEESGRFERTILMKVKEFLNQ